MITLQEIEWLLINEIQSVLAPRLYNIEHNTATRKDREIARECLGYLSLIKCSTLNTFAIKRIWENSYLKFM
jgi:hypothetical protein